MEYKHRQQEITQVSEEQVQSLKHVAGLVERNEIYSKEPNKCVVKRCIQDGDLPVQSHTHQPQNYKQDGIRLEDHYFGNLVFVNQWGDI